MTHVRKVEQEGYIAAQDFRVATSGGPQQIDVENSATEKAIRIVARATDDPDGRTPFQEVPNVRGDVHGLFAWVPDFAKRSVAMWRHVFPVVGANDPRGPTTPGGGPVTGGGGGGGPITPGGEVPGDSRSDPGPITPGGGGGGGSVGPITPGGGGVVIQPSQPTLVAGNVGTRDTPMPPIPAGARGPRPDSHVLPIRGEDWSEDDRFPSRVFPDKPPENPTEDNVRDQTLPSALPASMPSWARGTIGAAVETTEDGRQTEVLLHADPRMIAANSGGPGRAGTTVCDLDDDGTISDTRHAPLQGAFRVVLDPSGKWGLEGHKGSALALQVGTSGRRDTVALWADSEGPTKAAIALPSVRSGGPMDCVADGCKHRVGTDADGNPIVPLHLSASALFRHYEERSGPRTSGGVILGQSGGGFFDGPMVFETPWPSPPDLMFPVLVHLGWDPAHRYRLPRDGGSGAFYQGAWKWWTTSLIGGGGGGPPTGPDAPPGPGSPPGDPGDPPITGGGGGPGNPTTPGGGPPTRTDLGGGGGPNAVPLTGPRRNPFSTVFAGASGLTYPREHASMVTELVHSSIVGRAQRVAEGAQDLRYTVTATAADIARAEDTFPQVWRLESIAAQGGADPFDYTQPPGASRSRSGTANGMAVFMPPERDASDFISASYDPPGNAPSSNTAFVLAPGTELAFALPDIATGRPVSGVSLLRKSTGELEIYGIASDGTRELRVTLDGTGVVTLAEGTDIAAGTTTGTKIGTGTTQRIGFHDASPTPQQSAIPDATDLASALTSINAALAVLRTKGLIAT